MNPYYPIRNLDKGRVIQISAIEGLTSNINRLAQLYTSDNELRLEEWKRIHGFRQDLTGELTPWSHAECIAGVDIVRGTDMFP